MSVFNEVARWAEGKRRCMSLVIMGVILIEAFSKNYINRQRDPIGPCIFARGRILIPLAAGPVGIGFQFLIDSVFILRSNNSAL